MTIEDVKERVQKIKDVKDDYEKAHLLKDALWADVLRAVSKGSTNSQGLAEAALKTRWIRFSGYCA